MILRAEPHAALAGRARVPGDKSISHRALMLAGLACGVSRIEGLLEGEDVIATAKALAAMGVAIERLGDGRWQVVGRGVSGLSEPDSVLDMGNAGTGARLILGILAGHDMTSFLTGDASLRRRPMGRVIAPLCEMGASFTARQGDRLPLCVRGRDDLLPVTYSSPVASAQVKSAVLLAGLHAMGRTTVIEPQASRDHTERMLAAMGAEIEREELSNGSVRVSVTGQPELSPQDVLVAGDPSSAAFPLAAAAGRPGAEIRIDGVSVNPLRSGLLATLREMGGEIAFADERELAGEPVADLFVRGRELHGVDVPAARAPSMIDEYPVLAVLASQADGVTRMRGLAELRVKESDRLAVMAEGLAACGAVCAIEGDDLIVEGRRGQPSSARIDARLDHRIAMSFLVLGGIGPAPIEVSGAEAIATSFPTFRQVMNGLGARIECVAAS